MSEYFIDLDELVLRCRDKQSRQSIAEAVACYKAGAFRACVVTTWIAVVYDFIHKLRELELTGDANATNCLNIFEGARQSGDVRSALQFEKQILKLAQDEFGFISPIQCVDLQRLLDDRNRCAHPSMISEEEVFNPSPEMARYHLRCAITYLLQHPPVQGKAALERLENDIRSEYFPHEVEKAIDYFRQGPLSNPKDALVRNFAIILLKELLLNELNEDTYRRFAAALNAVRDMHRVIIESTFNEKINQLMERLSDDNLYRIVRFLNDIPDTWQFIKVDFRTRIENYVENAPEEYLNRVVLFALNINQLTDKSKKRLQTVNSDELGELIAIQANPAFIPYAFAVYETVQSFDGANAIGNKITSNRTLNK